MSTPLTQAIGDANAVSTACIAADVLLQQINQALAQVTSHAAETAWQNFATAALNTDGSFGAADSNPSQTHPMDTRTTNLSTLNRSATYGQYAAAVTSLGAIQATLNGALTNLMPFLGG